MATISGYDSSSIGVLFSSLNSGRTNTSTMFGTSDLLGINYSDYATIRNGSYTKLMKAYYKKAASDDSSSSDSAQLAAYKNGKKVLTIPEIAEQVGPSVVGVINKTTVQPQKYYDPFSGRYYLSLIHI